MGKEYINRLGVHWIKDDGMYSRMENGYHVETISEEEYNCAGLEVNSE